MPTERLSMRKIRELLRLRFEAGLSLALIAQAIGMSKASVGEYLGRARAAGVSWPLAEALDDTALERRLFPPARHWRGEGPPRPEPNWAFVDRELRRKRVARLLLWQEYRVEHPDGYGYAWFCETYDAWRGRLSPTMRQHHGAGEKVFVDFAGDTVEVIDPPTGTVRPIKLFVAAMGASAVKRRSKLALTYFDKVRAPAPLS